MVDIRLLFGRRVRELRRSKKLTQARLAEMLNFSVNYISQIETGQASPAFETLVKLASALEVEISVLFNFTGLRREG